MILHTKVLEKMSDEARASLGKAGMTADEAQAAFVAKNEAQLQTQIQTMLQRNGVFVVRQRTDKRSTVKIGCPDILFCVGGQAVAWEVKMPGKKPRPEQDKVMQDMKANGWQVSVVTTYDQALSLFRGLTREGGE